MLGKFFRRSLLAATVGLFGAALPGRAADHRDSPDILVDPAADLLDVYAFRNPNKTDHLILALTVNPAQLPGLPSVSFDNDVLYQFKIDNDGDFIEDVVIQGRFSVPGKDQQVVVLGPVAPDGSRGRVNKVLRSAPKLRGPANGTTITNSNSKGVTRAWAGLADDPFFFDLLFIFRALGILTAPSDARSTAGLDFYEGTNISALVVEVPISAVKGEGNSINVWATTSRAQSIRTLSKKVEATNNGPWVQIERTALPTVNAVLVPGARKEEFNRTIPSKDVKAFRQQFITSLTAVNSDAAYSATLVDTLLLPDVLRLDVTIANTGNEGGTNAEAAFPNGRRFADDVIDTVLNAASKSAVTGDGVNSNDKAFLNDFPFIAPPHSPREDIPARDVADAN